MRIYKALNPIPESAVERARLRHMQYRIADFSTSMLPMDLSEFYTRCELLASGDSDRRTSSLMNAFVEIGVDYIPEGSWAGFFNEIKYPSIEDYADGAERRVFIPDTSESVRNEICVVETEQGQVISAESLID